MKNKEVLINEILSDWNPIGVPDSIVKEEYIYYVKAIIAISNNEKELIDYLENILTNMGLSYNNSTARKEIKQVALKILSVCV